MLKKLLYLHNDGHNPFPKHGKGGLGYKPPINGYGLEWVGNDLVYAPDAKTTTQRATDLTFEMLAANRFIDPEYKKKEEVETPGFEFIEDEETEAKNAKEIEKAELLTLLESMSKKNTDKYLREIDKDKVKKNEERFVQNVYDNAKFIIQDLETKVHDTKYNDQEKNTMLQTMKTLGINYREKLIDEVYDNLYDKRRIDYPNESTAETKRALSGKAFEEYLCTTGKAITRKIFNTLEGNASNFDDNTLIPSNLQKYCVVDIATDSGIGEAKDFNSTNMHDGGYVAIQDTKIVGNYSFKIYFEKIKNDEYIVKFITCNNKPINNPNHILKKYNVIINGSDGIYYHDLLKNKKYINDDNMKKMQGSNLYIVDENLIPQTTDILYGSNKKSLRIDKSEFKKIENKKPKTVLKKTVKNIIV